MNTDAAHLWLRGDPRDGRAPYGRIEITRLRSLRPHRFDGIKGPQVVGLVPPSITWSAPRIEAARCDKRKATRDFFRRSRTANTARYGSRSTAALWI